MSTSNQELASFVSRVLRLEEEKDTLTADVKEVYSEAKSSGFDPKIMRVVVRRMRRDPTDLENEARLIEVYEAAIQNTVAVDGDDDEEDDND